MLGRPFSALGFQKGNVWAGIGGSLLALAAALAALFVLWNFTPLLENYLLPVVVQEQFLFFVLYEVLVNGFILLLFEVFFRGFIMLLWLRKFGFWSVFVQAVIFCLLFAASNGINAVTIPYLIFAPFAGLIAYQSRSLWYSYGASWFYLFLTDALVLIFR
jgi:membrane protease YdiL (CAAX protease family)